VRSVWGLIFRSNDVKVTPCVISPRNIARSTASVTCVRSDGQRPLPAGYPGPDLGSNPFRLSPAQESKFLSAKRARTFLSNNLR